MIPFAYSCFFVSGATALIFQVLWTRQLTQEMGGAPFAVSVVLTLFMAGLGLGAFFGGRLADRLSRGDRLLKAYALAEAAAAAGALLVPLWLRVWHGPLAWAYGRYQDGFLPFQLSVLAAALAALLPPAVAMGMSLPFLTRACARVQARLGRHLGGLYAINTLGAATGALAAGFLFIPGLGLRGTMFLGVGANAAIAVLCYLLAPRFASAAGDSGPGPSARPAAEAKPEPRLAWMGLGLLALSGFCAMGYEVLWTKLLTLLFGPTTYAFTLVLAAFITGLALGAWVFGRLADKTDHLFSWLLLAQAAAALLAVIVSHHMGNSLLFFQKADLHFHKDFGSLLAVKSLFVFLLMAGPTFFFGGMLPLAAKLWSSARPLGAAVGDSYSWNTAGAVLGSWCTGFLLLPHLGKENSIQILSAAQGVAVLACFLASRFSRVPEDALAKAAKIPAPGRQRLPAWGGAILAALALALAAIWPRWSPEHLARVNSVGLNQHLARFSWLGLAFFPPPFEKDPNGSLEYFGDGLEGFTAVWKAHDMLGQMERSLFLSGKADASSRTDMFTQTLLAHFPMAVHPNPQEVMVLGLASGTTSGEVLHYPVRRLDILEINPKVAEAARLFEPWNNGALKDPRARLILQDAKAHLLLSGRSYDVIISEPSNPWMAGLSELFTREFYDRARRSLKPGGVMVQFIHSYRMDWETLCLVGRTFRSVFPRGILVRTLPDDRPITGMSSDYLLVGWKGDAPWEVVDNPERRLRMGASRNVEISDPRVLYRLVVTEDLQALFGDGPLHTDDRPRLEFQAPRLMFTFEGARIESEISRRARLSPRLQAELERQKSDPGSRLAFASYALSLNMPYPGMADFTGASPEQREAYLRRVEIFCGRQPVGDFTPFAGNREMLERCSMRQMGALEQALKSSPYPARIYLEMANVWMVNGEAANAYKLLRAAAEAAPGTPLAEYALDQAARLKASQE